MPVERAPHVLYVAWGFPPARGGGVYRALATANALAGVGFRVTVLTAERDAVRRYTGLDPSLEARIDPRVRVGRVRFHWPARETELSRWSLARALFPRVWWRLRKGLDLAAFPEYGYGPWRRPLSAAARRVHEQDPVDLVVASANPNVDFAAADALAGEGVPYVMDYRDAWMLDVFGGGLVHPQGGRVDRLERRLLAGASEVWFVNDPIRDWHRARHPRVADRMHVVANGYDPQFAPEPRLDASPPNRPLTFGYLGTATAKVPLREFADGWQLARAIDPDLAQAHAELWGYLGFYATPDPDLLSLVDGDPAAGMSYRGPVPKHEVADRYGGFDVALLILGAGRYVTSGKVYEYAASALPIVSVHDPGNAASDVLRGYPLWFPVADLGPEAIAAALSAAGHAARSASTQTRRECREYAERFRRDLQLDPRVRALYRQVAGRDTADSGPAAQPAPAFVTVPAAASVPVQAADPEATARRPRHVVVLRGPSDGQNPAATPAWARQRLRARPDDAVTILTWPTGHPWAAAARALSCTSTRATLAGADLIVTTDRIGPATGWVFARMRPDRPVVMGWEAAAAHLG